VLDLETGVKLQEEEGVIGVTVKICKTVVSSLLRFNDQSE